MTPPTPRETTVNVEEDIALLLKRTFNLSDGPHMAATRIAAHLERLAAIEAAAPLTADGVKVFGPMQAWRVNGVGQMRRFDIDTLYFKHTLLFGGIPIGVDGERQAMERWTSVCIFANEANALAESLRRIASWRSDLQRATANAKTPESRAEWQKMLDQFNADHTVAALCDDAGGTGEKVQ